MQRIATMMIRKIIWVIYKLIHDYIDFNYISVSRLFSERVHCSLRFREGKYRARIHVLKRNGVAISPLQAEASLEQIACPS